MVLHKLQCTSACQTMFMSAAYHLDGEGSTVRENSRPSKVTPATSLDATTKPTVIVTAISSSSPLDQDFMLGAASNSATCTWNGSSTVMASTSVLHALMVAPRKFTKLSWAGTDALVHIFGLACALVDGECPSQRECLPMVPLSKEAEQ